MCICGKRSAIHEFYTDSVIEEYKKLGTSLPPLENIERARIQPIYQLSPYLSEKQEKNCLQDAMTLKSIDGLIM